MDTNTCRKTYRKTKRCDFPCVPRRTWAGWRDCVMENSQLHAHAQYENKSLQWALDKESSGEGSYLTNSIRQSAAPPVPSTSQSTPVRRAKRIVRPTSETPATSLENMPADALQSILSKLPCQEVVKMCRASTKLRQRCIDENIYVGVAKDKGFHDVEPGDKAELRFQQQCADTHYLPALRSQPDRLNRDRKFNEWRQHSAAAIANHFGRDTRRRLPSYAMKGSRGQAPPVRNVRQKHTLQARPDDKRTYFDIRRPTTVRT